MHFCQVSLINKVRKNSIFFNKKFCNVINAFTAHLTQFNESLLNKTINSFKKKNHTLTKILHSVFYTKAPAICTKCKYLLDAIYT